MKPDFQKPLVKCITAAVFLAVGLLLPLITGQLPQINRFLLPMHIPILLCGLVCGPQYGVCVGLITPLLRSAVFGLPVIYPTALAMALELAVYGLVSGLIYKPRHHSLPRLYISLVTAMLFGRLARASWELILLNLTENGFQVKVYIGTTLLPSIVGALLQLIIIPAVMDLLRRVHLTE